MNHSNSGIFKGTAGSGQLSFENNEAKMKVAMNELETKIMELSNSSPLPIPHDAKVLREHKNGYEQIKFIWESGGYIYTCRWHTRTPNAPPKQGSSWVVQRDRPGIGFGKNTRYAEHEILIENGGWVSRKVWQDAIYAVKNGTATQCQKEMIENGHWKADEQ